MNKSDALTRSAFAGGCLISAAGVATGIIAGVKLNPWCALSAVPNAVMFVFSSMFLYGEWNE